MNASSQALSISLTRKIANVAVMFRAEFPAAIPDLSPWLTDDITKQREQPSSIDLSFALPKGLNLLNSKCILVQILFSDALLEPTCHLTGIKASGHNHHEQCWFFSTEAGWQFEGKAVPSDLQQQRFIHLLRQVFALFSYPTA